MFNSFSREESCGLFSYLLLSYSACCHAILHSQKAIQSRFTATIGKTYAMKITERAVIYSVARSTAFAQIPNGQLGMTAGSAKPMSIHVKEQWRKTDVCPSTGEIIIQAIIVIELRLCRIARNQEAGNIDGIITVTGKCAMFALSSIAESSNIRRFELLSVVKGSIVLIIVMLMATSLVYADQNKHPSEGFAAKPMPVNYGEENYGLGPDMNYTDLTFHSPYPKPDTMTDAEKYMVAGCVDSDYGGGLMPWYWDVLMMAEAIRGRSGLIPDELSFQMLQACAVRPNDFDQNDAARFRSPITGEFPKLNAVEFEPGQVYLRLLTEEEKGFFASRIKEFDQNWNEGVQEFYPTGEMLPIEITTGIYYMRIYGEHDVILSTILYNTKWLEEPDYMPPQTTNPD